jgi:hypothetical protein
MVKPLAQWSNNVPDTFPREVALSLLRDKLLDVLAAYVSEEFFTKGGLNMQPEIARVVA